MPSGPMGAGAMLWQTEKTFQVGNSWRNYISVVKWTWARYGRAQVTVECFAWRVSMKRLICIVMVFLCINVVDGQGYTHQ